MKKSALGDGRNFCGEVGLFLLDAFAEQQPSHTGHFDRCASKLFSVLDGLTDSDFRVHDEGLRQQGDFFEELAHAVSADTEDALPANAGLRVAKNSATIVREGCHLFVEGSLVRNAVPVAKAQWRRGVNAAQDAISAQDSAEILEGANYYWFFTLVMLVAAVIFVIWSQFYRGRVYIQGEEAHEL